MREDLLSMMVDPADRSPMRVLVTERSADGAVLEGTLAGSGGRQYPIRAGIPRFVGATDQAQEQTKGSFAYKWQRTTSYGSSASIEQGRRWLLERYGFGSSEEMAGYMASRGRVLDAGCGGGHAASFWLSPGWGGDAWVGIDISDAIDVARERLGSIPATAFVQADVMQLPFADEAFDVVFSEGVLHHTPSTERAFKSLVRVVRSGGELMVYIYRRKSPVREFTDDHVRQAIAGLPPEAAWEALRPLTALGQALAQARVTIELPEPVDVLGIPAGRHDVQRLIYWHFAKLFWNDALSFEENLHVNFDWYHPRYAHRHTEAELRRWCDEAGLRVTRLDVQDSGFTLRAIRD
ncbi:MAG: methyltransferase domain-containing protein [Vicinamibacterales bacterium]